VQTDVKGVITEALEGSRFAARQICRPFNKRLPEVTEDVDWLLVLWRLKRIHPSYETLGLRLPQG